MRKLIGFLIVIALLAVGLSIVDVAVRHRVQTIVANKIQHDVPGTQAAVSITSFPFLGHLAVSGGVPLVTAHVTGVQAGTIPLQMLTVQADGVTVDRNQLFQGTAEVRSIQRISVTATISQATIDSQVGVPVTLGNGTVGVGGVEAPANVSVSGQRVEVQVPPLPPVHLDIGLSDLLPCLGGAHISPGVLTLTCTTTQIPPLFQGIKGSL